MRTVRDENGRTLLLLKESSQSSLVRDPATGEERYVENGRLEPAVGESPLETAARGVPDPVRTAVSAVRDDRSLGLLVELAERGPIPVRELLSAYDLCESDLLGLLSEFRAAGLAVESDAGGERGYDATDEAREAVARLRGNH